MSAKRKKRSKRAAVVRRAPRVITLGECVSEVVNRWADHQLRLLFGAEVRPKPAPLPRQVINVTPRKP